MPTTIITSNAAFDKNVAKNFFIAKIRLKIYQKQKIDPINSLLMPNGTHKNGISRSPRHVELFLWRTGVLRECEEDFMEIFFI